MARRRFFVEQIRNGQAEVTGEPAHHLRDVLRVERGQRYEIASGGRVWLAEVSLSNHDRVVFSTVEEIEAAAPPVRAALFLSLVKFDRFELAIEKATELGVSRIVPVAAARSEKGLERAAPKRAGRWRRIALEASRQSRRILAPELAEVSRFAGAAAAGEGYRYFLDEEPGGPALLGSLPCEKVPGDAVSLLVGPEGGWTGAEREQARAAGWQAVSLGAQVLRTETAAIAATAIVTAAWSAACQSGISARR
jgi:16S rRNA (uracil1498-N3)-methyltransferase